MTAKPDSGTIFLKDITKIDCGLFDPARGILGQSWHVDLKVSGFLDPDGFVYDFSKLKTLVRQVLKTNVDHALILPVKSRAVEFQDSSRGERWTLTSQAGKGAKPLTWTYTCPKGAVFPVRAVGLSKSLIAQEINRSLTHRLPGSITEVEVRLRDEDLDPTEAYYRYTHGIATHEGLCQRLFHGHKCSLEVYVGEERRPDLEHYVARDVLGSAVHIACPSQVVSGPVEIGMRGPPDASVTLAYEAPDGFFEATIPAHRLFMVEGETSVEAIARQLATVVAARIQGHGAEPVRVVCYEGIDKGAIAEA